MSIAARGPRAGTDGRTSRDQDRAPGCAAAPARRAGRRAISVSLLLIGTFAMVSGSWSLLLPRGSLVVPVHVASGSLVGLLSLVHARYNRNAIRLYLRDLGWSPVMLRILIAAAISLVVLVPALRLL
jgi:hypothetical protein